MKNILFIPGVLCDKTVWRGIAPEIERNFQVFYADITQQKTVYTMTEAVLRNAPPKFWAIGFSLGGWIALKAANLNPAAVEGLILINTSDGNLLPNTRVAMQNAINEMQKGDFAQYITESLALYLTPEHAQDENITHKMRKMMEQVGPEIAMQQYNAMLQLEKPFDFLNKITCPTLIIRGEKDKRHTIEMDQAFCKKIPNAKLKTIENAAHFISFEQPQSLSQSIQEFIQKNR